MSFNKQPLMVHERNIFRSLAGNTWTTNNCRDDRAFHAVDLPSAALLVEVHKQSSNQRMNDGSKNNFHVATERILFICSLFQGATLNNCEQLEQQSKKEMCEVAVVT